MDGKRSFGLEACRDLSCIAIALVLRFEETAESDGGDNEDKGFCDVRGHGMEIEGMKESLMRMMMGIGKV